MSSFIRTANGDLINVAGIQNLSVNMRDDDIEAIFADRFEIGSAWGDGDVHKLLNALASRVACQDGVFWIKGGVIYHDSVVESVDGREGVRSVCYGAEDAR